MYCELSRNVIYFESLSSNLPSGFKILMATGVWSSMPYWSVSPFSYFSVASSESVSDFFCLFYIVSSVPDVLFFFEQLYRMFLCAKSTKWKNVLYFNTTTPKSHHLHLFVYQYQKLDIFYFFLWALHAWIQIQCALNPKQIHL